jgi:hypothetical protein
MELQRSGSGAGRKASRAALILLLAAGVAPVLGNAVYLGAGWISEGGEYLADLPGLFILALVEAVPFVFLGACAVWTDHRLGLISVAIASLMVAAASAYGYWVVFFPGQDAASTDALIFLLTIPVQWVVAAIAGVVVSVQRNQEPLTREAA